MYNSSRHIPTENPGTTRIQRSIITVTVAGLPVLVANTIPQATGSRTLGSPMVSITGRLVATIVRRLATSSLIANGVRMSSRPSTGEVIRRPLVTTMTNLVAVQGALVTATQVSPNMILFIKLMLITPRQHGGIGTAPLPLHEATILATWTMTGGHPPVSSTTPCAMRTSPAPRHPWSPSRTTHRRSLSSPARTYKRAPSRRKVGHSYKPLARNVAQTTPIDDQSELQLGDQRYRRRSQSRERYWSQDRHPSSRRSLSRHRSQRPHSRHHSPRPESPIPSPHATGPSEDVSSKPSARARSRPIRQ